MEPHAQSVLLSAAFFAAAPPVGELMGHAYNRAWQAGLPHHRRLRHRRGSCCGGPSRAGQIANLRSAAAPMVQFRLVESVNLNGSGTAELSCIDFAEIATITRYGVDLRPHCGTADDEHGSITVPYRAHR